MSAVQIVFFGFFVVPAAIGYVFAFRAGAAYPVVEWKPDGQTVRFTPADYIR